MKKVMEIAQSDLKLAKSEFNRLKSLAENKAVSQSSLESAEQKYLASLERLQALDNQLSLTDPMKRQILAGLEMQKVLYQQAKLDLEKTEYMAPFNCWVLGETCRERTVCKSG